MSIRIAAKHLAVALLRLLTGLLVLMGTLVTLAVVGVTALTARIQQMPRPASPRPVGARSTLRLVHAPSVVTGRHEVAPDKMSRLVVGLVGLGFKTPAVKRFVDTLSPEHVETTTLPELIREGLSTLAA